MASPVSADRTGLSEGRQRSAPVGLEQMLRIYFLQHWFNLSDPAVEKALRAMKSIRPVSLQAAGAIVPRRPWRRRYQRILHRRRPFDRADGDEFPMTQEFLAMMLAVHRPGVNITARLFQQAGLSVVGTFETG